MKNEGKIVELLAEMLHKFDVLTARVDVLTGRVDTQTSVVEKRLGKVEDEMMKLNLVSAENSRAIMKLTDAHENRLARLEQAVFKI